MSGALELDAPAWALLRARLEEALALPAAQRAAWLEALSADSAALRPHLARLLAHAVDETGVDRFDALPALDPVPLPASSEAADAGPYRCLRLLGSGGMSTVWLAERTDVLLARPVALKRPRGAWAGAGLAQRMAQEREILGRLDHPNIARIYDAGVEADGQPWLALEYVDGVPIDQYVQAHACAPRDVVRLVLQVADAVGHGHSRLVVHRDLKPGNILVEASGSVRLLDFGIAKLVDEAAASQPDLTRDAPQPRTTGYAAPEQLLGQPVSAGTDVYALGVVLYELLTGARPYRPARGSVAALEEAVLHDEPVRPSVRVADRALARALRGDLDTIVLKALRKSPADRYRSMGELADDLERWLQSRPVRARRQSLGYRARKFVARNRYAIAGSGAFVGVLCAALAVSLWQADRARSEAAKARAIQDYLIGMFETAGVDRRDGLRLRGQTVQQLLEGSALSLPQALAGHPAERDELEHVVARLLTDLELVPAATELERQRVRQLETARAPLAVQADALRELGTSLRQAGDLHEARETLDKAVGACGGARGGSEAEVPCLVVRLERGRIDYAESRFDEALAQVEPATRDLARAAPGSLPLADALDLLGLLRAARNRNEEAVALNEQALALRVAAWGPESVRTAIARFRFGRDLWTLRHLSRAEAELREAWRVVAAGLGQSHPASARLELNLGRLTYYVGLRTDGLAHLQHATDALLARATELDPHDVLEARVVLGNALLLDGQAGAGGRQLEQALRLREQLDAAARLDPTLDQTWARWLLDQGRFQEARAWLEDLRRRAIEVYGPGHPDVADRSLRLAWVALAEGDTARAAQEIDQVLASQDAGEAVFGSVKHRAGIAHAELLIAQGRGGQAQAEVARSLELALRGQRENQYRDVLYQLHDVAARAAAQVGDDVHARAEFEVAIGLLSGVDPRHPYLAATRCSYALTLARLGASGQAQAQLELARPAFLASPPPGDQFRRVCRLAQHDVRNGDAQSVVSGGSRPEGMRPPPAASKSRRST